MRKLSRFEKFLFFTTREHYTLFKEVDMATDFNSDKEKMSEAIKHFFSKLKEEALSCVDESVYNKWEESIPENQATRLMRLMYAVDSINNNKERDYKNKDLNVSLGKDQNGIEVFYDIKNKTVKYFIDGKPSDEEILWNHDAYGSFVLLDKEKVYKEELKNFGHKITKNKDEDGLEKFIKLITLFLETTIMIDEYGYYIADEVHTDLELKNLGVFLATSFSYRYKKNKVFSFKIPSDFKMEEYTKNSFIENFALSIVFGMDSSSYIDAKKHIKKNITLYKNTSEGITVSIIEKEKRGAGIDKFFKSVLPKKEVYILN